MNTAQDTISINLMPRDPFATSTLGKVLMWALSIGRYIVVFTELIVIISFLSRFRLDRTLTDLNEGIARQKAIVLSYKTLEEDFRRVQAMTQILVDNDPVVPLQELLLKIARVLPPDVKLDEIHVSGNEMQMTANALTTQGFSQFVRGLESLDSIGTVSLDSVETEDQGSIISFNVSTILIQAP